MANTVVKYGLKFNSEWDEAQIERSMIHQGGKWMIGNRTFGLGLMYHFKRYWELLWPEDDQTWWTDLILEKVLENQFVSLVGPASSWKSGTIARIALMDWSVYPDCTSVIMSSTDMEGLRSRIYGETTMLWKRANERYSDWFPGFPVDHKCVITSTNVEDDGARDIRNSILGVPCKTASGQFIGMGKYSGRKNVRVWCIGDEFQFMQISILQAQDNLISNGPNLVPGIIRDKEERNFGKPQPGYKCVFIGNTNPSVPNNPLDVVSEPEDGWGSLSDEPKTRVWKCRQHPQHPVKCVCINLDALDSPNSTSPIDKPKYQRLAGPHKLANYTEGSESYFSQGRGVFKFGLAAFKIITKDVCDQFHAFDSIIWKDQRITKIGMCDAAYGVVGGDRCAVGYLEFAEGIDGVARISFGEHWLVPIVFKKDFIPEDQIAQFCREKMESALVPPENFFFDGRGSLAMSFARIWSPKVNAVEFGGVPTNRPAGPDIYTTEENSGRRLKTAREHYVNFVSELWWAWRYVVESDQMRRLPLEIVIDGQPREWKKMRGGKIQVETKREMKKRTGISPDLADMLVVGIEGARRRGFSIDKLSKKTESSSKSPDWFQKRSKEHFDLLRSRQLAQR